MSSDKDKSGLTYKDAGVDRTVSESAKGSIKDLARATHTSNVLKGIGLFSGFWGVPKNASVEGTLEHFLKSQ